MRALALIGGLILFALICFGSWWIFWPHKIDRTVEGPGGAMVKVSVPELSATARLGEKIFSANCTACHGQNAAGSDQGPPLVHRIYEPGHHGDASFYRATLQGVQAHHWEFGNMPAVEGVSERDVEKIVRYIRELQRANGVF